VQDFIFDRDLSFARTHESYLSATIVSKAEDLSLDSEIRDAAVEEIIEERRQQALKMIEKMREEP
jgi:hypothetical protein